AAAGQPIEALRLLVDGRPLPDGQGVAQLAKAEQKTTIRWTIPNLPAGKVELKVLARCPDVSGVSDAREVVVPVKPKDRPALHLIAVGLNDMGDKKLALNCPKNDAEAIHREFVKACVGPANLFGPARSTSRLLVDQQATAKKVLATLQEVRKQVRPGDLLVFF